MPLGGKELKEDVEKCQSPEEKPDATVKATCRAFRNGKPLDLDRVWGMELQKETGNIDETTESEKTRDFCILLYISFC